MAREEAASRQQLHRKCSMNLKVKGSQDIGHCLDIADTGELKACWSL